MLRLKCCMHHSAVQNEVDGVRDYTGIGRHAEVEMLYASFGCTE